MVTLILEGSLLRKYLAVILLFFLMKYEVSKTLLSSYVIVDEISA